MTYICFSFTRPPWVHPPTYPVCLAYELLGGVAIGGVLQFVEALLHHLTESCSLSLPPLQQPSQTIKTRQVKLGHPVSQVNHWNDEFHEYDDGTDDNDGSDGYYLISVVRSEWYEHVRCTQVNFRSIWTERINKLLLFIIFPKVLVLIIIIL